MLKNYLKIALRNMTGAWGYSLLNVVGLAAALAVFILILLHVRGELAYDRFHEDAERLLRVVADVKIGERTIRAPLTPGPLAPTLERELPAVAAAARLHRAPRTVRHGREVFLEEDFLYADASFFELFDLPLRSGDRSSALARPFQVVLSADAARRYFGDAEPRGRELEIDGDAYTVTGVVASDGIDTHLDFDFLAPLATLRSGPWIDSWLANNFYTYVELAEGADPAALREALPRIIRGRIAEPFAHSMGTSFEDFLAGGGHFRYELQAVEDIHLRSDLEFELGDNGSLQGVQVLSLLALFVLLIACINYMNLATARAAGRSLEVGMRKTLGAHPGQLRLQFLFEALLTSLFAMLLGTLLAAVTLDRFNALVGGDFTVADLAAPPVLVALLLVWLLVGLTSGAYPAFVLSAFPPISMVRRWSSRGRASRWFRNSLVVFQFAVGVVLIIGSLGIRDQMSFLLDKDLGFEPREVVVVERAGVLGEQWRTLKEELLRQPAIAAVAGASAVPGGGQPREIYLSRRDVAEDGADTGWLIEADADYFRTLGIDVLSGDAFEPGAGGDVALISPVAARRLDFEEPLGARLRISARPGDPVVVGTFRDVHVESLRRALKPAVIRPLTGPPQVLAVRARPGRRGAAVAAIESTWKRFAPDQPLRWTVLEQRIEDLYREERRVLILTDALAVLAVFVASLGIIGLAAYAGQRRMREIGVRKVLGATPESIVVLLARDFLKLVLLAVLIAVPLAVVALDEWLESFAFRIALPWWAFAAAGSIAVAVAILSLLYQAWQAALVRPVESLRRD
jgi:putative ABC transport system permease protein